MTGSDRISEIHGVLAAPRRRAIVRYYVSRGIETASYGELLEAMLDADCPPTDRSTAKLHLHHTDLPSLQQADLVELDERSETVRYQGPPLVEHLLTEPVPSV